MFAMYMLNWVGPRFPVSARANNASPGLITDHGFSAAVHQVVSCAEALRLGYGRLILSVNRQQRAGNETHSRDTANNTHLSRHAASITIL